MKKTSHLTLLVLLISALASCGPAYRGAGASDEEGDTIAMRYARNITLVRHSDYVEAKLKNPWDTTQTLARYELRQPVQRAVAYTSVMCALMEELGVADRVVGVADAGFVHCPYIKQGIADGRICDVGNSIEPDVERILRLSPDALLPSPFEHSGGYGSVEQLGINIYACADYMEVSPLARAEWIRFYGILFGCEERADSIFAEVERAYLSLKAKADSTQTRPTIIVDTPYNGVWYLPGGRSTTGILYTDAGATYLSPNPSASGGIPLAIETVLRMGMKADVWLMRRGDPDEVTRESLREEDGVYTHFNAYQQGEVYCCNTEHSDFYEETPFHPERLLANLIAILHPETGLKPEYVYYNKVK